MDGNNSYSFLKQCKGLIECPWFPSDLYPVITAMQHLKVVTDKTFSWELQEGWEKALDEYKEAFSNLQGYSYSNLGVTLRCSWKIHIITAHLKPFLTETGCGLARYAEQTGESVHHFLKPTLQHHRRKECHPKHGEYQLKAIAEFSANNL